MYNNTKIFGLICEFNPLHNGHKYIIDEARRLGAGYIVAVMSGNYVQRGEMAVFDKWSRTKAAIACGVDVVVELPLPWAMSSADTFCRGGVSLLNVLGFVDGIIFGSECGDLEQLSLVANLKDTEEFKTILTNKLTDSSGKSYATVYNEAVENLAGQAADILKSPNNTLALGYMRELNKQNSDITPYTIKRAEEGTASPSATAIRKSIRAGGIEDTSKLIPLEAMKIFHKEIEEGRAPVFTDKLELAILSKLRSLTPEELLSLPDISEGIENKLVNSIKTAVSLDELYSLIKSKRYTMSRVHRLVMNSFLDVSKELSENEPPYIRILGMSKRGSEIIPSINKLSKVPVMMRYKDLSEMNNFCKMIFNLERRSDNIFALAAPNIQSCERDLTEKIIIQ